MKRIDTANAAASADTPVAHSGGNSYFSDTPVGTILSAQFLNDVQEEIVNVVEGWGGVLDGTDRTQLYTVLDAQITAAGGAGDWLPKTANYTAVAGDKITAKTGAGSWTLTLPASPTEGQFVQFKKSDSTLTGNTLTIGRNGNDIMNDANDIEITEDNIDFTYVWDVTDSTWYY